MSLPLSCDTFGELCCDECHFQKFTSQYEFNLHCTAHKREPIVTLVKLSEYSFEKLQYQSYKVNGGVAKKSINYVSPLKIALKKQEGTTTFQVIKNKKHKREKRITENYSEEKSKSYKILKPKNQSTVKLIKSKSVKEVEGNNILERFGANISVSRKRVLSSASQGNEEAGTELDDNENINNVGISVKLNKEKTLRDLSTSEFSVRKSRSSVDEAFPDEETKLQTTLNVLSNTSPACSNLTKIGTEISKGIDDKILNNNKILEKLNSLGFSLIPKGLSKIDTGNIPELSDSSEKENKVNTEEETDRVENCGDVNILDRKNSEPAHKKDKKSPDDLNNFKLTVKSPINCLENKNDLSDNGLQASKKHVRVKNSIVNKKNIDSDRRDSSGHFPNSEVTECTTTQAEEACIASDTSDDVAGTLVDELRCTKASDATYCQGKGESTTMKLGVNCSVKEKLSKSKEKKDFIAERTECTSGTHAESQFVVPDDRSDCQQESDDCTVLLNSDNPNQNGDSSTFSNVSCSEEFQSDHYANGNNSAEENNDEVSVAYSSLPDDGQSTLEDSQENPLIANEPEPSNGDGLNPNFLHDFLNEPPTSQSNIQSEGSEFMSLERLGQVSGLESQHGQSSFDLSSAEGSTPMEQLSQQVQRLPNPPQINVITPHHIQAPQPPQLHTGLSQLSSPQTGSFDPLAHIPPPLPPPLYQGYNMYNQNFTTQGPQQLPPRPPMLQQRPQIQGRSFQGMSAASRPRHRSYPIKRNSARMSSSQEVPHKQRRLDSSPTTRNQQLNQSNLSPTISKIPSGITVTPSRKSLEASKVADVLASRGITVTPSNLNIRQSPPSNRSQQKANPILNLGPGVSITANNGNRSSGGFAVPSSRRNNPIVNSDVERPERCATVDLTQDDDYPSPPNRTSTGRFSCNQCRKVFSSFSVLEDHKVTHRSAGPLPFKCDKCTAQYPNASGLRQHKVVFHKAKEAAPDLAIPIVDLNHPGARDNLAKCGIRGFIPLSQLQSTSLGYFGVPIIHIDATKEKAVSNLNSLGAANVLVLGKMKALTQPQIR